jgi:hypothetical protein
MSSELPAILIVIASLFVVASALFVGYFTQKSVPDERAWLVKRIKKPLLAFSLRWYGAITGVLLGTTWSTTTLLVVIALNVLAGLLEKQMPWRTAVSQAVVALVIVVVQMLTRPITV